MLVPMTQYTICACYFMFSGVALPASLWKFNELFIIAVVGYVLLYRMNKREVYTRKTDSSIAGYIKDKDLYPYLLECAKEFFCEEVVLFLHCMINELKCFGWQTPALSEYPLELIRAVYQKFIEEEAQYQLNLSAKNFQNTKKKFEKISQRNDEYVTAEEIQELFKDCYAEVIRSFHYNIVRKFLKIPEVKEIMETRKKNNHLNNRLNIFKTSQNSSSPIINGSKNPTTRRDNNEIMTSYLELESSKNLTLEE
eukprot:Pgem_evm2s3861